MEGSLTTRVVLDTSVYVAILRDARFARNFRSRYEAEVPRTYMSSVVVQELLAGAWGARQRRQAEYLSRPFERVGRVVAPTHRVWKEAGLLAARIAEREPAARSKLRTGLLNDILIALSARSIGATVVTRNRVDFQLIQAVAPFRLEVL